MYRMLNVIETIKLLIFLFLPVPNLLSCERTSVLQELGEKQYQIIKAKSSISQHGTCWQNIIKSIKSSCDNLNDEEHSLLALKMTHCFLEDSGHKIYNCHLINSDNERRICINNMSDRGFSAYNEFYIHSTHICFYLNHEARQFETDNIIKQLYHVSSRMKDQLLEATEVQGAVLESQKQSLRMQNQLLDHGKELGDMLKTSSESVNSMVNDFRESAKDQRELLFQIFSYLRTFQNWIIGEVSWFQSVMYYTVCCIICALFSSSKRTADARVTLFTILSLNIVTERMLVQYYDNVMNHLDDNKEALLNATWIYRKVALSLCVLTLVCTYYWYKDEQMENYETLKRIEKKLSTIQEVTSEPINHPIRYYTRQSVKRLQTQESKQADLKCSL